MCLSARGVLNRFLRPREVGEMILASVSQCHAARCLVFHFATRQTIYFSAIPYMPCAAGPVSSWTGMLDVYRKSNLRVLGRLCGEGRAQGGGVGGAPR